MSVADSDGLGPSASQVSGLGGVGTGSMSRTSSLVSGASQRPSTVSTTSSTPTGDAGYLDYNMNQSSSALKDDNPRAQGPDVDLLGLRMGATVTLVGSAPVVVTEKFPGNRPPLDETAQGLRDKWNVNSGLDNLSSSHYGGLLNRSLQDDPSPKITEVPTPDFGHSYTSPSKSYHGSYANLNTIGNHDADSGISNTFGNGLTNSMNFGNSGTLGYSRVGNNYSTNGLGQSPHLASSTLGNTYSAPTFSKPYTEVPSVNRYNKSVSSMDSAYTGSANGSVTTPHDLQRALQESEDRRHLLVEKLKDARSTIEPCPACLSYSRNKKLQSEKLEISLCSAKDLSISMEDAKLKERELRRRIDDLEKDKASYQNMRLDAVKIKEEMYSKVSALDAELKSLRTSYNYLEADSQRKQDIVEQTCQAMTKLEEDNSSLLKNKETMSRDMAALKDSMELAKSRNEQLENQMRDHKTELERLKRDNADLQAENKSLRKKITELKEANHQLKDENAELQCNRNVGSEEKHRMLRQLESFQDAVADLKATLASTSADKERFFQEKLDLHQQLQNAVFEKESAEKARATIEEQMNEIQTELEQAKFETNKKKEAGRKTEDELGATKKVSEVLSTELATTKTKLEKVLEQNDSLEHAKKLAFQQHSLYEQEIKTLEQQLENMRKSMDTLRKDHAHERDSLDDNTVKMKEELRCLKAERNQLEMRNHQLEAQCKQTDSTLKEHSDSMYRELQTWKNNCEKLTSNLSRKEIEIQSMSKQVNDLQEEAGFLKVNNDSYQKQHGELMEARDDLLRVQEENRRLLQERVENQQVIKLLEMQKSILAKASDGILSKSQDADELKVQMDQVSAENNLLKEKVSHLETVRDDIAKKHQDTEKKNIELSTAVQKLQKVDQPDIQQLRKQNKEYKHLSEKATEKLTELEKEFASFRSRYSDTVPRVEYRRLEQEKSSLEANCERVQTQYETLEQVHHRMIAEKEAMLSDEKHPSVASIQTEKNGLERQVQLLSSQITSIEGEKKRADNEVRKLESLVSNLQRQIFNSSSKDSVEVTSMQRQIDNLQGELEDSKRIQTKQEALIQTLKDELEDEKTKKPTKIRQSLDDVGEELNNMRSELHKLMAVIQMKDQEIEQLENQLRSSKTAIADRDTRIEHLMTACDVTDSAENVAIVNEKVDSLEIERSSLKKNINKLTKENRDLSLNVDELTRKLNRAKSKNQSTGSDAADLPGNLEEELEKERKIWQEKLRRELSAKDRQIESLEEQLRHATNMEIKKMRRDASKVDLLKQENRRLQNQLNPTSKWHTIPKIPLHVNGSEVANGDSGSLESYDSSDGLPYTPHSGSLEGNLARELVEVDSDANMDKGGDSTDTLTDAEDSAAQTKDEDTHSTSTIKAKPAKDEDDKYANDKSDVTLSINTSDLENNTSTPRDSLSKSADFSSKNSSSLADLTAPRPWRRRFSVDSDDKKDKETPQSDVEKKQGVSDSDKRASDGYTSDLAEKIRSRRNLINSLEKTDTSDSDRPSAYARRRAALLNTSPDRDLSSRSGRSSSLTGRYRYLSESPSRSLSSRFSSTRYK